MFGHKGYYNETTRKYVSVLGTLFNDIEINRIGETGETEQTVKVPISYGPAQKFLAKIIQDPDNESHAINLPRMSFEITSLTYDPERRLNRFYEPKDGRAGDSTRQRLTAAPYNVEFELNIMTKYHEDGFKIMEQIVPFFQPEWVPTVYLLEGEDRSWDIPITLNNVSPQVDYQGNFEERNVNIWTLNFTLKGYYFGPMTQSKVIKFAKVNTYGSDEVPEETVNVQPGLTANGEPTDSLSNTVPYTDIESDDNWGYIVTIEERND